MSDEEKIGSLEHEHASGSQAEVGRLTDPDAGLSPEERAKIVCLP